MDKRGFLKKIIFLMLFFLLAIYMIRLFEPQILAFLEASPILWAIFQHMREQVQQKTLLGLGYLAFAANLFLLMFPVEAAAAFYFTQDYNPLIVIGMLIIATTLAQFFNWLVGLLLGRHVFKLFLRHHWEKWESHSNKWGLWMLILFSVLPFMPLDTISVFLGSTRYKLRGFLLWIMITTAIKYILI
jgi:membrane protein YqaA with SNARE-associated domain